jgi:hypothetical protein
MRLLSTIKAPRLAPLSAHVRIRTRTPSHVRACVCVCVCVCVCGCVGGWVGGCVSVGARCRKERERTTRSARPLYGKSPLWVIRLLVAKHRYIAFGIAQRASLPPRLRRPHALHSPRCMHTHTHTHVYYTYFVRNTADVASFSSFARESRRTDANNSAHAQYRRRGLPRAAESPHQRGEPTPAENQRDL